MQVQVFQEEWGGRLDSEEDLARAQVLDQHLALLM